MRNVFDIQNKMDSRIARVFTAREFKEMVRKKGRPPLEDVDAVTTGTFGVMSGTMAVVSIPVCGRGVFRHAKGMTLNGVPATVGPCPNESLGIVDAVIYGTSRRDMGYGGGHLFRDMAAGNDIEVSVETDSGETVSSVTTISEIPFARMITTRSAFRNYTCFSSPVETETIFRGPEPMSGGWSEATFSGCGDINPLQNDPSRRFLKEGAAVYVNGAPGIVLGEGTRSSDPSPNLSVQADMHLMRPEYMGGFRTSSGPECTMSIGAVIPVLDEEMLDSLSVLNEDVKLPIADVENRVPACHDSYGSVWTGDNSVVQADMSRCLQCDECEADAHCPRDASPSKGIDRTLCMDCGNCIGHCAGRAFSCDLGTVRFDNEGVTRKIPVSQRQSSRAIAEMVCRDLKHLAQEGRWSLGLFERQVV